MKFLQKTLQDHLSLVIWASQRIHLPSRRCRFDLWSGRSIPWRRKWGNCNPTPVLLPGNSHRQRSLVGYSPWGREESNTTEPPCNNSSSNPAAGALLTLSPRFVSWVSIVWQSEIQAVLNLETLVMITRLNQPLNNFQFSFPFSVAWPCRLAYGVLVR